MIGLFIGRFQPFHNGHLKVLRKMQRECDEIIIGVGSANKKRSSENPLTAKERVEIIREFLIGELMMAGRRVAGGRSAENNMRRPCAPEVGAPLYKIVKINDKPTPSEWIAEVRKKAGNFDYVYVSSKGSSASCLRAHGFKVKVVPVLAGVSGTKIRELMRKGGKWEQLVPANVANTLNHLVK